MNPFQILIRSRKFWLMILDVVISTVTYFLGTLADPAVAEKILWLIAAWQPVIVTVIGSIAYEDAANMAASANLPPVEEPEG
jgi:ABC-type uncharacterized transport system permease subunit